MTDHTKDDLAGGFTPGGAFTTRAITRALASSVEIGLVRGSLPTMVMTAAGLEGAMTPSGTITTASNYLKTVLGALLFTAGLPSMVISRTGLSGAIAPSSALGRGTGHGVSGALTFSSALNRGISRLLTGAVTLAGALKRGFSKLLTGALTFVGAGSGSTRTTPSCRTHTVPLESRTFTPESEDRTFTPESEDRTYTVKC